MNEQRGAWTAPLRQQSETKRRGRTAHCAKLREEGWAVGRPQAGGRRSRVSPPCFTQGTNQTRVCPTVGVIDDALAQPPQPLCFVDQRPWISLPLSRAEACHSTAQQQSRSGGRLRATCKHTGAWQREGPGADVVLACLQRRRPLWRARDQRRRVSCGGGARGHFTC